MSVNVIFTGPIKRAAGLVKTTGSARSVEDLIEELSRRFGGEFIKEVKKAKITVNGYAIQFGDGLKTRLGSGDTVNFVQPWRIMDD